MKLKIILILFFNLLLANSLFADVDREMPPMPPAEKPKEKPMQKFVLPHSCRVLPQMIVFLPPPMEADYHRCRNDLGFPNINYAQYRLKKLIKDDFTIKNISIIKDFNQLYEIEILVKNQNISLYCNSSVTKCIRGDILK
jgi:hypothetical protein